MLNDDKLTPPLDRDQKDVYLLDQPHTHSRRTASTGAATGAVPQHYCFNCDQPCDCHMPVTDKYYALDHDGTSRSIVCEQHYYTRLNLLCKQCGEPLLEGTPLEIIGGHKYHEQCVRCPGCLLAKKAPQKRSSKIIRSHRKEYYFDDTKETHPYNGRSYCPYHFSLVRGTACQGCGQAVLSQLVNDRIDPEKRWHHECFMIQKYWNVRLADQRKDHHDAFLLMSPDELSKTQTAMETKRKHVWNELKVYEDSLTSSISDLALNITAGACVESIRMANQVAWHLYVLFSAHQKIHTLFEEHKPQVYECDKWSRVIGAQVLRLFDMVDAKGNYAIDHFERQDDFTKDVVRFVTTLATNLKECLRLGITEALEMEHEYGVNTAMLTFLDEFAPLKKSRMFIGGRYCFKDEPFSMADPTVPSNVLASLDACFQCNMMIEDGCWRFGHARWHTRCLLCSGCHHPIDPPLNARIGRLSSVAKHAEANLILLCDRCTIDPKKRRNYTMQQTPLSRVTQLEQCMHLLRVAVARVHQVPSGKSGLPANNKLQQHHVNKAYQHITRQQTSSSPSPARRMTLDSAPAVVRFQQEQTAFGPILPNHNAVKRTKSALPDFDSLPRRAMTIVQRNTHDEFNNEKFYSPSSLSSKKLGTTLRRALSTAGRPQQQRRDLQQIFGDDETPPSQNGPYWLAELTTIQDSIVRSLAALYVERHVSNHFQFEELLSLVECKKESLWGKVKMHFRTGHKLPSPSSSMDTSNGKIFGAPLSVVPMREKQSGTRAADSYVMTHHPIMAACFSENALVPVVVQNIILALLQQDLRVEGIFRKNGNIRELKETCDMIDKGYDYVQRLFQDSSAIQLAALLKRFVRDLPEPLLTFKLHKLFLTSLQMDSDAEAKTVLYFACCMLPKPNRDVMQLLFLFLNHVASYHEHNRMDLHNLARIFAPSVLYASPLQTTREEIDVVTMLIKYQADFTMVPPEFTVLMQDTNMMKALYNADLTSSKEFIRTYSSLMKLRKDASSTRPGDVGSISPLATRSAVVLPTTTPQQVGR
ncbi:hypothetical protein BJV82DRAFT_666635 [Fennellomyces sp. T-0311]|nr:hypothetical protein BJV82DRAFT_666635 [Fennellomyces sp. T-0311]